MDEAREAVSEFIQETGVSMEESLDIVIKSPNYMKMLMESIRDLDELSLWNSYCSKEEELEALSLRKKVIYIAKEKGDSGKVAFLESIGLSLSSSMRIARYLSSDTLPSLIHKVKYVKDLLFSGFDDEDHVGKIARRMMMHLSIPVDEDVQQTLSFFEKIEARRGGLSMLGSADATFAYLLESFPRLLSLSVEFHMKPTVKFLEAIGIPQDCMRFVLLLFPPIIFYDLETDTKPKLMALETVGIVDKDFGKTLVKYPWLLSASVQENYREILSFFEMEKIPKVTVNSAIKSWPYLLGCSTGKMKLMVEQFAELGVTNKKLAQVISTSPQLLVRKHQEFLKVVSFLEDLGFDLETIGRILTRCPEIFAASIDKTLKKKLKFLAAIGISKRHLPKVIRKYPELFVSDTDKSLIPRLKYLMNMGLSKKDIAFMLRGFSPLLGYSVEEVLRPKVEFLVNTMEKPLTDVVAYPRYFSYSLEKKIKPRFWVLKGRNINCSLKEMLGKNDEEFAAEFMGIGRMLVPPPPPVK